ncbi:glycosyltransferase [Blautia sp. HCP3S3_H10_1]|uniref:glycosyltransferase n=1 Tax=unclassified Blautia TaxID=2648079 RepID=UPI003F921D68
MKVMQVIPMFGIAGAEVMCKTLTLELIKRKIDVFIVSLYSYHSSLTEELEDCGVKIYYLEKKKGLDFNCVKKLKTIINKEKPDIIHNHLYSLKYVVWANSNNISVVHTVHNVAEKEVGYIDRKIYKYFFRNKSVIPVALTKKIRDSISTVYSIPSKSIPIIFNGIDLTKCIPKVEYQKKKIFKIVHIGRFMSQKNHIGLVNAFKKFHELEPNSELLLVGDGELKEYIQNMVCINGLDKCVKFVGLQKNIYPILNYADVFILPSLYEGMPMTLIEAMGTGTPIIATKVGGIMDMLNDSEAILIDCTEESIVLALQKIVNNCELQKKLGTNARKKAYKFSASTMAVEYLKVYEEK